MRVIAGQARGMALKGPPDTGTRATADKVRGAIFNVLAAYLEGARVLDLYAGTGALGLEALSRGAAHCDFVERRHALCQVIHENLARTRLGERSRVLQAAMPQVLSTLEGPYDVILADPPYAERQETELARMDAVQRLLGAEAILVLEHSPRVAVIGSTGSLRFVRTRRYGDSAVSYWQREEKGGPS